MSTIYDPSSGTQGIKPGTQKERANAPRVVGQDSINAVIKEESRLASRLRGGGGSSMGVLKTTPGITTETKKLDFGYYKKRGGKLSKGFKSKYQFQSDPREVDVLKGAKFDYSYQGPKDKRVSDFKGGIVEGENTDYTPGQSSTGQGYQTQDTPINQQGGSSRVNMTGAASVGMTGMAADTPINQQIGQAVEGSGPSEDDDSDKINR